MSKLTEYLHKTLTEKRLNKLAPRLAHDFQIENMPKHNTFMRKGMTALPIQCHSK